MVLGGLLAEDINCRSHLMLCGEGEGVGVGV